MYDDGFEPWLDEKSLIAGQDWRQEVTVAVRRADVVVVCLSQTAVAKKVFVHSEIGMALDVATEQPEGSIYIVPVRLELCVVPLRLERYQYVDLYSGTGYPQLTAALRSQERRLELSKTV